MTERPCGDGADARYCETFWAQHAEIERLTAELDAARSALTAAEADSGRLRGEVESANELLKRAADALWESSKAALTVKPNLDKPYDDDPRWTPWARWAERPAHEAHDAAMAIRKHLRADAAVCKCPDSGTCAHSAVSGTEGAGG